MKVSRKETSQKFTKLHLEMSNIKMLPQKPTPVDKIQATQIYLFSYSLFPESQVQKQFQLLVEKEQQSERTEAQSSHVSSFSAKHSNTDVIFQKKAQRADCFNDLGISLLILGSLCLQMTTFYEDSGHKDKIGVGTPFPF